MENEISTEVQTTLRRSKLFNPLEEAYEGKYGGQSVTLPARKTVLMPTVAAKVIGRGLVTTCIERLEFGEEKVARGTVSRSTVDKQIRAKYNVMVFGEGVDEFGNPPILTEELALEDAVKVDEVSESEPVEDWPKKKLIAKAKELGVWTKDLITRPQLEKAVKSAL